MKSTPLQVEWEFVEGQDSEAQLLEVFKILLNYEYLYEEQTKETKV